MTQCSCTLAQRLQSKCDTAPHGPDHLPVRATFIALKDPAAVGVIAAAGFDAVVVDREHSTMNPETVAALIAAAHAAGTFAIVRIAEIARSAVQDALEAGADGILAPMVENEKQAMRLVSFCTYPPEGTRGFHPLTAGSRYGRIPSPELPKFANDRIFIAAQIESAAGIMSCAKIAEVPGLHQLFLGPGDLALSLGVPPGARALIGAATRISGAAKAAGKTYGTFVFSSEEAKTAAEHGARLVVAGADIALLHASARRLHADIQESLRAAMDSK